jgi:hypothetical protein
MQRAHKSGSLGDGRTWDALGGACPEDSSSLASQGAPPGPLHAEQCITHPRSGSRALLMAPGVSTTARASCPYFGLVLYIRPDL